MKLIAIDMDGTLLNDENYVSEKQINYLTKLLDDHKAEIVITTGRPIMGIKNLLPPELYNRVYKIALNGSILKTPDNDIIQIHSLKSDDVLDIVRFSGAHDADISILDKYNFYSLREDITKLMHYDASLNKMKMAYFNVDHLDRLEHIAKVLVFADLDKMERLRDNLPQEFLEKYSVIFSQDYLIEFLPKNIDKGKTLLELANLLGISKESIVAIGDGLNDNTMLEIAGISVAMENAHPSIKELADIISVDNNNHGVMYSLERIEF